MIRKCIACTKMVTDQIAFLMYHILMDLYFLLLWLC